MANNVIDFNKSKEKLINKMYPNVSPIIPVSKMPNFVKTNEALLNFKKVFNDYQDSLTSDNAKSKMDLDEVLFHFNRFFEVAYNEFSSTIEMNKTPKFKEAFDYAVLSGGKRLRPFLMFVSYNFCKGVDFLVLVPFMLAMELIHTFSLVHDDLPCMDNDTLRRGKETVWKKYGEDMAVLVGDALLMEATTILTEIIFEFAYTDFKSYATTSALLIQKLAGLDGMIGGQVFDVMNTTNSNLSVDDIVFMYNKKTTALLTASIVVGANMSAKYSYNIEHIDRLCNYIGEAYQIKDDLLEVEGTEDIIGKSTNSDKDNGKVTYVSKVGVSLAKKRVESLYNDSIAIVDMITDSDNKKESIVFKNVLNYLIMREK